MYQNTDSVLQTRFVREAKTYCAKLTKNYPRFIQQIQMVALRLLIFGRGQCSVRALGAASFIPSWDKHGFVGLRNTTKRFSFLLMEWRSVSRLSNTPQARQRACARPKARLLYVRETDVDSL